MGQSDIYALLKEKPMTTEELAEALGVRTSSVINAINKMVKSNIVVKEFMFDGKSRKYIYTIEGKNGN